MSEFLKKFDNLRKASFPSRSAMNDVVAIAPALIKGFSGLPLLRVSNFIIELKASAVCSTPIRVNTCSPYCSKA